MKNSIAHHLLNFALAEAQKAHKKLRQLRNKDEATDDDVADAAAAIEALRRIMRRHDLKPIDLDSKTERRQQRDPTYRPQEGD